MTATTPHEEIVSLREQIASMSTRLHALERAEADSKSREFIRVNGITKDQVQMSAGPDMPYNEHISGFVQWLKGHPGKRWAEWNGRIYHVSDLLAMRMVDTPGFVSDLKDSAI